MPRLIMSVQCEHGRQTAGVMQQGPCVYDKRRWKMPYSRPDSGPDTVIMLGAQHATCWAPCARNHQHWLVPTKTFCRMDKAASSPGHTVGWQEHDALKRAPLFRKCCTVDSRNALVALNPK